VRVMRRNVGRDCVLCPPLRFRFNEMANLPGAGSVLASDEDFFLMPDLAPLSDGHLLLVTARHYACAGAFDPRLWARARRWRDRVARLYREAYGTDGLLLFEHGPGTEQGGGACIDHAHWHLLPTSAGLRAVVEEHGLPASPASPAMLRAYYRARRSYVMVEEDGHGTVHPSDGAPTQFLRWAATVALERQEGRRTSGPWRWQETFASPGNRSRFMDTLETLRAAAIQAEERADSHQ
jgi:diadenosine tetraphosphate (Ap4A) HIT family hydrolase